MSDTQEIEQMLAYLRQHQAQYNLEALQQQLVASGRRPELVAEAMRRLQTPTPQPERRRSMWPLGFAVAGVVLVLSFVIAAIINREQQFDFLLVTLLLAAAIDGVLSFLLLIPGAVVQIVRPSRLGLALVFGGLIGLALVTLGAIIFFGVCTVMLLTGYGVF